MFVPPLLGVSGLSGVMLQDLAAAVDVVGNLGRVVRAVDEQTRHRARDARRQFSSLRRGPSWCC